MGAWQGREGCNQLLLSHILAGWSYLELFVCLGKDKAFILMGSSAGSAVSGCFKAGRKKRERNGPEGGKLLCSIST